MRIGVIVAVACSSDAQDLVRTGITFPPSHRDAAVGGAGDGGGSAATGGAGSVSDPCSLGPTGGCASPPVHDASVGDAGAVADAHADSGGTEVSEEASTVTLEASSPDACGADGVLENGVCVYTCRLGRADCNGTMDDGCEVDQDSDPLNCGGCGNWCGYVDACGGQSACVSGSCVLVTCPASRCDCDFDPSNGCEANISVSQTHCGDCWNPCSDSMSCQSGVCVDTPPGCVWPLADCNADPADGCEVDLTTDSSNCGACSLSCSDDGAVIACVAGLCDFECPANFANCDGVRSNGCETPVVDNVLACGDCGTICSTPNGTPECVGTQCGIASCYLPWDDCDQLNANGCETSLLSDLHCGACDNACPIGQTCIGGACQ